MSIRRRQTHSPINTRATQQFQLPPVPVETPFDEDSAAQKHIKAMSTALGRYFEYCVEEIMIATANMPGELLAAQAKRLREASNLQSSRFYQYITINKVAVRKDFSRDLLQQYMEVIEQAAASVVEYYTDELAAVLKSGKEYFFSLDGFGAGADAGDVGLFVKDLKGKVQQVLVLELKFQYSASADTRWFGKKDSSVFKQSPFWRWLFNNPMLISHDVGEPEWIARMQGQEGFGSFMAQEHSDDDTALFRMLIQKEVGIKPKAATKKDVVFSHGGSKALVIIDLDRLINDIGEIRAELVTTKAEGTTWRAFKKNPIKGDYKGYIAKFSMGEYGTSEKTQHTQGNKTLNEFTFQMYLSQRLWNV